MSLLYELIRFEYIKIIRKPRNIIILLIGFFLTVFSCVGPLMGDYYINGEVFESNYEGMKKDREYISNISNREVSNEILLETIEAYSQIPSTDGKYVDTKEYQLFARPYSELYYMLRKVYHINNWEEIKLLTEENVNNFYLMRQKRIEDMIEATSMNYIEKTNALNTSQQVKIPFIYTYTGGYQRLFSQMYTTAILICFICSICIAPLFAGENADRMDHLILASKYGKNKVIYAKLVTGITFAILLSVALTLVSFITVMLFYGFDGGNAPIQLFLPLSIHPFTMREVALLYFILIIIGNIFSTALVMLLSSQLKSPFAVVVIITVVTFLPMFIGSSEDVLWLYHLIRLIPVNMFYLTNVTSVYFIDFFGLVIKPYTLIVVFAILSSISLLPFAYLNFRERN